MEVLGFLDAMADRESVPEDRAVELREGEAVDLHAWLKAELGDIDLQLGPLAGFGQFAHVHFLWCAHLAEGDGAFLTPECAVVPAAHVELEHDRLGEVLGLEVGPNGDDAVGRDHERGTIGEEVLGDTFGGALEGPLAAVHRALAGFDEGRGVARVLDLGLLRESVLEPDRLAGADGRRRRERGGVDVFEGGYGVAHGLEVSSDFNVEVLEALFLFGGSQLQHWRGQQDIAVHGRVGRAVEERVERVELLGRDWIKLVVVADRAARGEAHPHAHGGVGAIDRVAEEQLVVDGAAFAGGHVASVETAGDALFTGRVRLKVAGELPGGEHVKG